MTKGWAALLLLVALRAHCQGVLEGKVVRDTVDGPAVPLAIVKASDGNQQVSRNPDGGFRFEFQSSKRPGDRVKVEALMDGMVEVNWFQLDLNLPKDPRAELLTVILTTPAKREEMTLRHLRLTSLARLRADYQQKLRANERERGRLVADLERAQAGVLRLSAALAQVEPERASGLQQEAMRLLAEGDVAGALALYEVELRRLGRENLDARAALFTNAALTMLERGVTSGDASVLAAAAVSGWRAKATVDAWNAMQRTPVVRKVALYEQNPFGGTRVRFAAAQADGALTLNRQGQLTQWHANGTDPRAQYKANAPVGRYALSQAGAMLAGAGADGVVTVWELGKTEVVQRHAGAGKVRVLKFSRNGKWLVAYSEDHRVRVWETRMDGPARSWAEPLEAHSLAVCGDGDLVAVADASGYVRVVFSSTGEEKAHFKAGGALTEVAFAPDCRQLTTLEKTGVAHIVASSGGAEIARVPFFLDQRPADVALNADGTLVVAVLRPHGARGDYSVWLESLVDGRRVLLEQGLGFNFVDFSADGNGVAIGSFDPWSRESLNAVALYSFDPEPRSDVYFSSGKLAAAVLGTFAGRERLALAMTDGAVIEAQTEGDERQVARLSAAPLDVAFSADGLQLLSVDAAGRLARTRMDTGQVTSIAELEDCCQLAAFSPDARWLVTMGDGCACGRVLEVGTGKVLQDFSLPEHEPSYNEPTAMAISSDRRMVAVGHMETETAIFRIPETPTGGSGARVRLEKVNQLPNVAPAALRFSQRGSAVAVGTGSIVRIMAVEGGQELVRIHAGVATTHFAAVFNDSVVMTDERGRVQLWDGRPGEMLKRVCAGSGMNLSRKTWQSSSFGVAPWSKTCEEWPTEEATGP